MTNLKLNKLFDKMWLDYIAINPLAQKIHELLVSRGETISNDHIALRTFNHPRVTIDILAKPFVESGYFYVSDYHFPEKKLYAKHFEHKESHYPKIFISELKLEEFSLGLNQQINQLIDQIPSGQECEFDFSSSGRPWEVTSSVYENLFKESDYAAWVSAFGYRPNHFTVFINELKNFSNLEMLNTFLKDHGFKLNSSGGEIKGSKEVFLEQSSTLANNIEVEFTDKKMTIPACYYEFAKRYAMPNGQIYQGFVATSADKIFESTRNGQ